MRYCKLEMRHRSYPYYLFPFFSLHYSIFASVCICPSVWLSFSFPLLSQFTHSHDVCLNTLIFRYYRLGERRKRPFLNADESQRGHTGRSHGQFPCKCLFHSFFSFFGLLLGISTRSCSPASFLLIDDDRFTPVNFP